jgi:hypothetical protein
MRACDTVKWEFLQENLRMKGFSHKWCDVVKNFVEG